MSKRLAYLETLIAKGQADSFARYAYALELKGAGRLDDALAAFEALREHDAAYVPMYLMCGQMLIDAGRAGAAVGWIEQGIAKATAAGDSKAIGELKDALARCGS